MLSESVYVGLEESEIKRNIVKDYRVWSKKNLSQVFLVDTPSLDRKYEYEFDDVVVVLSPGYKICFINLGDEESFDDFCDDFCEDLGVISDNFEYKEKIGRPKKWRKEVSVEVDYSEVTSIDELMRNYKVDDLNEKRKIELIISLVTGSINDVKKIDIEEKDNLLDIVKNKIMLFDVDQTNFIYDKSKDPVIRMQGLSGTGKTELLLHKLKEVYLSSDESRILFTCHNKILAKNLRERIPSFFDFMQVKKQIHWQKRLWCIHGWGGKGDINSGTYRYLCDFYNYDYETFYRGIDVSGVYFRLADHIKKNHPDLYAFDYSFLDESQDFPESFIGLLNVSTRESVYISGDIFQSIFDEPEESDITPKYTLNKCYRTDPRTLMLAHSMGMGLFEKKRLQWLSDESWKACGYQVKHDNSKVTLKREPIRRFSDGFDISYSSVLLKDITGHYSNIYKTVLASIQEIKDENPTVKPDDIGVVFIDGSNYIYECFNQIYHNVMSSFGWEVNNAVESKTKKSGQLFLSNRNNVKGLEFPFVICVTRDVTDLTSYRNALYMMMTRSFLKSYLLIDYSRNEDFVNRVNENLNYVNENNSLLIDEPSEEEKAAIKARIISIKSSGEDNKSIYEITHEAFEYLGIDVSVRPDIFDLIKNISKTKELTVKDIESLIVANSEIFKRF